MSKNNLANKFKGKNLGTLIILSLIFLLFAALIDLKIINKSWFIKVEKEYIYYVYAALGTVSTISITVLSLITNSLEKKYFGIPIKEIFNSKKNILRLSNFILLIFMLNIFATFFLAIKYINCVVSILIITMAYIYNVSKYLWELSTNDTKCKDEIELYLQKNDYSKFEDTKQKIDYLIEGLSISKNNTNLDVIDKNIKFIVMIRDNENADETIKKYIQSQINIAFDIISKKHGLFIAIDKVLVIMDSHKESKFKSYDNWDIIEPHIKNIQFVNDSELYSLNLDKLVTGLENIKTIAEHEKVCVLYNYFKCLLNNEVISKKVKNSIITSLIEKLVQFSIDYKNRYNYVQQKVILNILKYYILLNQEFEQAEFLVKMLSLKLYRGYHCKYEDDKYFYETIALIYFTIYLYSENEVETISQEHRKRIKKMMYLPQDTISNKAISFQTVITKYFDEIIKALFNISEEKFQSLTFLENFENFNEAKSVVWSFTSLINFAMCNFFLTYKYNNPIELIDNWENIKDKDIFARVINDFFDIDKENDKNNVLRPKKHEKINSIAKWISRTPYVNKKFVNTIGKKINNTAKQVNEKKFKNNGVLDDKNVSEKIKKQVNEKFENYKLDEYSTSIELSEDDKEYYFAEIKDTQYLQEQYHEKIVDRIYEKLLQILYNEILKSIEEKTFEYNKKGVKALIEELKTNSYNKTNFNLKSELFNFKNKLNTEDWTFLEQLNLEKIENKYLKSKVVYKGYLPKFNIKVKEYKIEKLNDTECEKYSENFKISNEYYKIDNAYYTKSEVMDLIYEKNRKVVVIYTFKIEKPNNFSGIKLKFDYTKLDKEDEK